MSEKNLVLYMGAGVTIRLPVDVSFKHNDDEENDAVLEDFAKSTGAQSWYLETIETEDRE